MGDIYKRVKICGLTDDGRRLSCTTVKALIDTGATKTVISKDLADRVQASDLRLSTSIEDRQVPLRLIGIQLVAPDCLESAVLAAADDRLVNRAGRGAEMILGQDYLQDRNAALRFQGDRHEVACNVTLTKKAKKRKRK